MDPKDFPKNYGGELNWDWGDLPNLDAETRSALEKDGNKGWIRGPCLWLDGKRIAVGSDHGKPRRPNVDLDKMKPVIYAADYTETPVHPDKRASIVSKSSVTHETAPAHHRAEEHAADATGGATATNIAATKSNLEQEAQLPQPQTQTQPLTGPAPVAVEPKAHTQPHTTFMPADPQTHIQPQTARVPAPHEPQPAQTQTSHMLSAATYAHPPSQPEPGPIPQHTVSMTSAIQDKLASESLSVIPATADGHANGHATGPGEGHPEVIVASDMSKGLAIETEKLAIAEEAHKKSAEAQRPPMERFVTAVEM